MGALLGWPSATAAWAGQQAGANPLAILRPQPASIHHGPPRETGNIVGGATKRLAGQSVFFSDFMADHADGLKPRRDGAKALVHIHCHQHAVIKADGERKLLDRLGLDYEVLPSGCCGMAGAFGFAPETHDVSVAAGERVLLPRVRAADSEALVLANGFSCREQIEQGAGRKTLHVAELAAQRLGV